jgi:hypothetical protein
LVVVSVKSVGFGGEMMLQSGYELPLPGNQQQSSQSMTYCAASRRGKNDMLKKGHEHVLK